MPATKSSRAAPNDQAHHSSRLNRKHLSVRRERRELSASGLLRRLEASASGNDPEKELHRANRAVAFLVAGAMHIRVRYFENTT